MPRERNSSSDWRREILNKIMRLFPLMKVRLDLRLRVDLFIA